MIGVLSLDPDGTILAARVTPDRTGLVGERLSSVWAFGASETVLILDLASSWDGYTCYARVLDSDGFPVDRIARFTKTGQAESPHCLELIAHAGPKPTHNSPPPPASKQAETGSGSGETEASSEPRDDSAIIYTSPDRDVPSSKATSTIGATDGARSADESGVIDAEKTDPSNASPGCTSPSSLVGGRHVSARDEFESGASGEPGSCMEVSEPGYTSSHDDSRARSAEIQLHNQATHSSEPTRPVATDEAVDVDIYTALDAWVGTLRVESTSVKETQNKRRAIEFFIDESGWESPSDATAQSIEAGKRAMVGNSSKTIRNKLSRLHVFLDFCVSQGWLETNAAKMVKPPKLVRGEGVRALSSDEILRLMAAIPPQKMYRFHYYAIAAWTGLRLSECKGLKWKDVVLDTDEPYIELPAALAKSRKVQTIPVVNEALPHFNALRTDHPSPNDRVFDIVPELRTFNRDLARAGIPKHDERGRSAGIHSLRKHLGSALAKAGADIYTVQQMMRHADINTTRNIYIDDRLLDLGNKAREALSRQGGREARVEPGDAAEAGEAEAFGLRLAEG